LQWRAGPPARIHPQGALREPQPGERLMLKPALLIKRVLAVSLIFSSPAHTKDHGQWNSYRLTEEQRAWFKSVTNRAGSKCCDNSDGYPVEYEMRPDNHYWIHFHDRWFLVPEIAVVRHVGNPTGSGIAWFMEFEGALIINCFVPVAEF
jgi:hypothetical protein